MTDETKKIDIDVKDPVYISFEEFSKVEIKIGKILTAEKIDGSDKLIKLQIDFGSFQRTIVSGVAKTYSPEQMVGKQVPVVMNLAPRKLKGVESEGMVLFAIDETPVDGVPAEAGKPAHKTIMLHPEIEVPPSSPVQ